MGDRGNREGGQARGGSRGKGWQSDPQEKGDRSNPQGGGRGNQQSGDRDNQQGGGRGNQQSYFRGNQPGGGRGNHPSGGRCNQPGGGRGNQPSGGRGNQPSGNLGYLRGAGRDYSGSVPSRPFQRGHGRGFTWGARGDPIVTNPPISRPVEEPSIALPSMVSESINPTGIQCPQGKTVPPAAFAMPQPITEPTPQLPTGNLEGDPEGQDSASVSEKKKRGRKKYTVTSEGKPEYSQATTVPPIATSSLSPIAEPSPQQPSGSEKGDRGGQESISVSEQTKITRKKKSTVTSEGKAEIPTSRVSAPTSQPGSVVSNTRQAALTVDTERTKTISLPPRPDGGGKLGQPIRLIANCWNMNLQPMTIWMYDIEPLQLYRFEAGTNKLIELRSSPKEKREYVQLVMNSLPKGTLWDGGRTLYSETQLPGITPTGITKNFDFDDPINLDKKRLSYRIKETGMRNTGDVLQFIERPNGQSICSLQDSLRILDCVFKLACKGPFASLGRMALFDQNATKTVWEKLMVIHRGFVLTARPQWKMRVNVDMTCKAFFPSGNLADVIYNKYGNNMCSAYKEIERDLRGIRLLSTPFYKTNCGKPYQRKFTVHGISSQPAANLIIKDLNQSVQQYFAEVHHQNLKYPDIPCVKVKKTSDVFIPMELLEVIPFQTPTCSKVDVTTEVIRCAAVKPMDRFRELQTFVEQMLVSGPLLLRKFGISVSPLPQEVTGRVLPPPTADFGVGEAQITCGKWEARQYYSPACKGRAIRYFVLSLPRYRNDVRDRQDLITNLPKEAANRGITFDCAGGETIYPPQLEERMRQLQLKNIDLVILILSDDYNYSRIKRLSDLQMGIRTQCIRSQTFTKRGYLRNLLLKINIKLDGVNWILPCFGNRDEERIMVLGADVTHPSATQRQELRRSLAAVVGSLSKNLMQYRAIVCQQPTKRPEQVAINEVIDNMRSIMRELLQEYHRCNNGLPTKLIFYRDGVSEGQFEKILLEELSAIQKACYDLCPGNQIPITFIVVQKRHHIKCKPQNAPNNIPPGTVIDTEVTLKSEFDFYLCSQEGIQGTSKPAHYRVLYDDNNYRSDALQTFTYALCHAYMRCTRSVSYPAPTYYSHLAAFRAREWLNGIDDSRKLLDGDRFVVHDKQKCSLFFC